MDKMQKNPIRTFGAKHTSLYTKPDNKQTVTPTELWKARQLRDHRRANGLCFKCGDKYTLGHKCLGTPVVQAQLAVVDHQATDGGGVLSEEVLNALEMHYSITEENCYLSINVVARTQNSKVIHLRALAKNQALSILVDSGSSHTFLNASMLSRLQCLVSPAKHMKMKVANEQQVMSDSVVKIFEWWIQGHTF
jgi:hypothetical protein